MKNKEKISAVLDYFADKSVPYKNLNISDVPQIVDCGGMKYFIKSQTQEDYITIEDFRFLKSDCKIVGFPVLIGDVLEKIKKDMPKIPTEVLYTIIRRFEKVGFSRSLNEIFKSEVVNIGYEDTDEYMATAASFVFKNPNIQALLDFLYKLTFKK